MYNAHAVSTAQLSEEQWSAENQSSNDPAKFTLDGLRLSWESQLMPLEGSFLSRESKRLFNVRWFEAAGSLSRNRIYWS